MYNILDVFQHEYINHMQNYETFIMIAMWKIGDKFEAFTCCTNLKTDHFQVVNKIDNF